MSHIEIHDGIANRRINIPELTEPIRIDLGAGLSPCVVVSDRVQIERFADRFSPIEPPATDSR